MAYLPSDDSEDKATGGSPGFFGAGSGAAGAMPTGDPQKPQTGGFTNLRRFMEANRPQSDQLAARTAGSVGAEAQKAQSQLQDTQSAFESQAEQATVQGDQDFLDNLDSQFTSNFQFAAPNTVTRYAPLMTGKGGTVPKPEPAPFQVDPQAVERVQQLGQAEYTGPTQIEDMAGFSGVIDQSIRAEDRARATETEEGRFSLLRDLFGRPTYTQGQRRFDQALLTASPEAGERLGQVREQILGEEQGLLAQLQAASAQAQERAAQARATTEETAQQTRDRIAGLSDPIQQAIQDDLARQQAERDSILNQRVGQMSISGNNNLGLNQSDFFTYQDPVVTSDLAARVAALQNLRQAAGLDPVAQSEFMPQGAQVGDTFDAEGQFQQEQYENAVASRLNQYNTVRQSSESPYGAIANWSENSSKFRAFLEGRGSNGRVLTKNVGNDKRVTRPEGFFTTKNEGKTNEHILLNPVGDGFVADFNNKTANANAARQDLQLPVLPPMLTFAEYAVRSGITDEGTARAAHIDYVRNYLNQVARAEAAIPSAEQALEAIRAGRPPLNASLTQMDTLNPGGTTTRRIV